MKLWEVMRLLEENPKREFEAKLKGSGNRVVMSVDNSIGKFYMFDVYKDGSIIGAFGNEGAFNGNVSLDLDWYEVKQPVPWQEAIQAWADGKKVVWEEDGERRVFDRNKSWAIPKYQSHLLDQDGDAVTVRMVSGGKWYVED